MRFFLVLAATCGAVEVGKPPPPPPPPPPPGGWRCCWLGDLPCSSWTPELCPDHVDQSDLRGCHDFFACTGPCSSASSPAQWCQTSDHPAPLSDADPPLRQRFRPPQQTVVQATSMKAITDTAVEKSAGAKGWVLGYLGSEKVRKNLDPSLQHYSDAQLLEMMSWEFERLPLLHNAPADGWDVDRIGLADDSPMSIALHNGNLQQPCQRYVLGGPESLGSTIMYANMYVNHFSLKANDLCDLDSTLRKSNECMMYNANNLRKTSLGNIAFGSLTYVLDTKALAHRAFWEPLDGGIMFIMQIFLGFSWPKSGTIYPQAWYHLLEPHERMFELDGLVPYKTIAKTLNYWWVLGAPLPTSANTGGAFTDSNDYFEVMTNGNVWLPEDLVQVNAKFASEIGNQAMGLFGTKLGDELRMWMTRNNRPVIWVDSLNSSMLIDPEVASKISGFSGRGKITEDDRKLFSEAWSRPVWNASFEGLAQEAAPHLHLKWQSWFDRAACAELENNASNHIMGVDGNGDCVFWADAHRSEPPRWECLNDGTCSSGYSDRATFKSEASCLTACGSSWECVRDIPDASNGTAYCLPRLPDPLTRAKCGLTPGKPCHSFASADACEAGCVNEIKQESGLTCMAWWNIIIAGLVCLPVLRLLFMYCVVRWQQSDDKRQGFGTSFLSCCTRDTGDGTTRPWDTCLFVTCCPCLQWFRVLFFLLRCRTERTQCQRGCGQCAFCMLALCSVCPPCVVLYCACNFVFGSWISACTRCALRRRLKIEGTFRQVSAQL